MNPATHRASSSRVAVICAVLCLIPACNPSASESPSQQADSGTSSVPIAVGDLITSFGAVGVPVTRGADDLEPMAPVTGPESRLRLLEGQVVTLAADLEAQGGITGSDLDQLVEMPDGAPPFSYLPAGWLANADTPASELARDLIGDVSRDWAHPEEIVFPHAVLLLFVADISGQAILESKSEPTTKGVQRPVDGSVMTVTFSGEDGGAEFVSYLAGAAGPRTMGVSAAGVCSGLTGWVNSVLNDLFESLHLSDSVLPTFLEDIWNWAVDLAQGVVEGVAAALTLPIKAVETVLKTGIAVVGVLSLVTSLLETWEIDLTLEPTKTHSPHTGTGLSGTATVAVKSEGDSGLRSMISTCAADAGIPLPSTEPGGKKVEWKLSQLALRPLVDEQDHPETLDSDGTATLPFVVLAEQPDDAAEPSSLHTGIQFVRVEVHRMSKEEMDELFSKLIFSGNAGVALELALGGLANKVKAQLAALGQKVSRIENLQIDYHLPESTTTTTAGPTPSSGCPYGEWESVGFYLADYTVIEGGAGASLLIAPDGSGTIDFTGSEPVVYLISDPELPGYGRLEVADEASFEIDEADQPGVWDIGSVAGSYSVTVSVDVGSGWIAAGSDSGAGVFGDVSGASILCDGEGNLYWTASPGGSTVSWFEFQPDDG